MSGLTHAIGIGADACLAVAVVIRDVDRAVRVHGSDHAVVPLLAILEARLDPLADGQADAAPRGRLDRACHLVVVELAEEHLRVSLALALRPSLGPVVLGWRGGRFLLFLLILLIACAAIVACA